MIRVETIEGGLFHGDVGLRARLVRLAAPCYTDAEAQVHEAFQKCDQLDLGYLDGELVAFFLTRNVRFTQWCGTYLHLLVASPDHRGSVVTEQLLTQRATRMHKWVVSQNMDGWHFGTTVNPRTLRALARYGTLVAPRSNSAVTLDELSKIRDIRESGLIPRWAESAPHEHPCVLRGIAATRYSEAEVARVALRRQQDDLFDELRIDERRGDRILFLARLLPVAQNELVHSNHTTQHYVAGELLRGSIP